MIENLQKSYETSKEDASNLVSRLQAEIKDLHIKVAQMQTDSSSSSGVLEASKASMEILQKSLIQSETELTDLRKRYEDATTIKIPKMQGDLDDALRQIDGLTKEKKDMASNLAKKEDEIELWKKKFAVQERERETLIEGWKDIVQTAGSSKSSLSGSKSSKTELVKKAWR